METITIMIAVFAAAAGGAASYFKAVYLKIIRNGHFVKKFWSEVLISSIAGILVSILITKEWDTVHAVSLLFLVGFSVSRIIQDLREKITKDIENAISEKLEGGGNEPSASTKIRVNQPHG